MTGTGPAGKIITIALCACLLPVFLLSSCKKFDYKSPKEIYELVSRADVQEKTIIVDIRSQSKYRDGHLPGAVNIPSESKNFEERIARLDRESDLVMYCGTGLKTDKAAGSAGSAGFKKVYVLQGGIDAWEKAGFALVK